MPDERNAFKLGLTLIIMLVVAVGLLLFMAPEVDGDLGLTVRYVHSEISAALKPGAAVICGGQKVGSVEEVGFVEAEDESGIEQLYVDVSIEVLSALDLREDVQLVPTGPLLGGGGKVEIRDRGEGTPLAAGALVMGAPAGSIDQITTAIAEQLDADNPDSLMTMIRQLLDREDGRSVVSKVLVSLEDINAMTQSLRNEMDPNQRAALLAKLHGILENINTATGHLRDQIDSTADDTLAAKLHGILDTVNGGLSTVVMILEENREPIHETVLNVRSTSEILEEKIAARLAAQLDPADGAALIAKVHIAIESLNRSLKDINTITEEGKEIVVLNEASINTMVENLAQTSDHLKSAAKDIRRNPWRLFYQPTQAEAEQANVFDSARELSQAAADLDDVIIRIQAIAEAEDDAFADDSEQLQAIRDRLQQTFDKFKSAEQFLWDQLKLDGP